MRWGGNAPGHRRRSDDLRLVAGLLWFALFLLVVVVVRPL